MTLAILQKGVCFVGGILKHLRHIFLGKVTWLCLTKGWQQASQSYGCHTTY